MDVLGEKSPLCYENFLCTTNIKYDVFALDFQNGILRHKICKFYVLWHHLKNRAKKSNLYFC